MYIYLKMDEILPVAPSFAAQFAPEIENISTLICEDGLLNPLQVKHTTTGYKIIDGMKRYCALARLNAAGTLPRSLNRIPCIMVEFQPANDSRKLPTLITNGELYDRILDGVASGQSAASLAMRYDCSEQTIEKFINLQGLHPEVLACFRRDHLSFSQATAFASLPNPNAQWDLLKRLGPFVKEHEIFEAIENGETVITLPNGECVILPSRNFAHLSATKTATYKIAV